MKAHKRLQQALRDAELIRIREEFKAWLRSQPGSVKRGLHRGRVELPERFRVMAV